jgi:uncharacterized protein (DUF3820 family)
VRVGAGIQLYGPRIKLAADLPTYYLQNYFAQPYPAGRIVALYSDDLLRGYFIIL